MATATTLPFSVMFWGSHPDEGNDDCHSGDDFATIEEARAAFDDWQTTAGSDAAYTTHVQLDGPEVHEIKQVVSNEELTRRKRAREQEASAKFERARWAFADAAVDELRRLFTPEVYTLMMQVLGTRARQDLWASERGHRWETSGKFIISSET